MGPEGGERGGMMVSEGSPKEIIKSKKSITAKFLRKELESQPVLRNIAAN
jgi:excinuclease ABC subunit A